MLECDRVGGGDGDGVEVEVEGRWRRVVGIDRRVAYARREERHGERERERGGQSSWYPTYTVTYCIYRVPMISITEGGAAGRTHAQRSIERGGPPQSCYVCMDGWIR